MTMKSISRDIPDTSFDATAGGSGGGDGRRGRAVKGPHAIVSRGSGSLSELHL